MPDEKVIQKTPPHSDEAEQAVIGSMLMDADAVEFACTHLEKDDFYSQRHGLIFDALKTLYNERRDCDLITLAGELTAEGHMEEAGDMKYLGQIAGAVPTSAHIRDYVKIVKDDSLYRRFIRMANGILAASYSNSQSIDDLSNSVSADVSGILSRRVSTDFRSLSDILPEALTDMQEAYANGGVLVGIPSGFTDLDKKTYGFKPSDLIIVGARPSMGKTAFGISILSHLALKQHKVCAMFSLEMSNKQVVNRLISSYAGIELGNIMTGQLGNDWEKVMTAIQDMAGARLFLDDTGGITISEIRTKCRKLLLEQKQLDFILVDYLQLMSGTGRAGENRQQEVAEISRGLKILARELNVPIMALSQLSRAVETRPDHRPIMADIRESGSIEQDADLILFLYRDEYYHPDTEDKNIGEVIIGKQRNGELGTVKLRFDGKYTRFANFAK